MARQVAWRKARYDDYWRAIPSKYFKVDCKLMVVAGVRGSSILNYNAKLVVELPDGDGKYKEAYECQFRNSHVAKEIIDSLLVLLYFMGDMTSDSANQWLLQRLSEMETPEAPGAVESTWATIKGWSC